MTKTAKELREERDREFAQAVAQDTAPDPVSMAVTDSTYKAVDARLSALEREMAHQSGVTQLTARIEQVQKDVSTLSEKHDALKNDGKLRIQVHNLAKRVVDIDDRVTRIETTQSLMDNG